MQLTLNIKVIDKEEIAHLLARFFEKYGFPYKIEACDEIAAPVRAASPTQFNHVYQVPASSVVAAWPDGTFVRSSSDECEVPDADHLVLDGAPMLPKVDAVVPYCDKTFKCRITVELAREDLGQSVLDSLYQAAKAFADIQIISISSNQNSHANTMGR